MFALMVAFSAAGIWSDAIQARGAVQREANSIENVVAIASSFPDEFREEVRREILLYARRTVQRDWPAMRRRAGVDETLFERSNSPLVALRPGGLSDRSHGCALGNERHLGARTDPDIDTAGHHRLRHLAAAGSTIVRSSPCFLKMPSLSPTLTGMIGSAFGAALPTVSVAAVAGVHPVMIDPIVIANAASNRPRHRILTMVLPHLSPKLRRQRTKMTPGPRATNSAGKLTCSFQPSPVSGNRGSPRSIRLLTSAGADMQDQSPPPLSNAHSPRAERLAASTRTYAIRSPIARYAKIGFKPYCDAWHYVRA